MSEINSQLLALKIKELCKANSISVNRMLEEAGVDRNFVFNLSKGCKPSIDKISAIAEYFNVSIDFLVGRTDHAGEIFFKGFEPDIKALCEREEKRQAIKSEVLSSDIRDIFQTLLSYVQPDDLLNIIGMVGYDVLESQELESVQIARGDDETTVRGLRKDGKVIQYSPWYAEFDEKLVRGEKK